MQKKLTEDVAKRMVAELTATDPDSWHRYEGPKAPGGDAFWFSGPARQNAYVWSDGEGPPVKVDVWVEGHSIHTTLSLT